MIGRGISAVRMVARQSHWATSFHAIGNGIEWHVGHRGYLSRLAFRPPSCEVYQNLVAVEN